VIKKNSFGLICFFYSCLFTELLFAQPPELTFSDKPPSGFEDLSAPQQNSIDVYFGDNKIADALALFSPTQFEFSDPQAVLKAIPHLKDSEKNSVLKALTGNLAQHTELICQKPNQPVNCGRLKPEIAGIIFNAGNFKLQLFINPSLLEIIHLTDNPYIPFPETKEFSFIQNLTAGFAGSNQDLNYNLRSSSILSYYLTRLRLNSHLTETEFQLDMAALETEWRDTAAVLGMFRTQGVGLVGQQEILGLRFATSFKQRTDLRTAYGNELVLFLPQRAIVKVFRENQLLFSQRLEAGNQTLDSSYFPDGVYDLDIVIDEDGGNNRTEHYFFAKSIEIPPLDNPLYIAELGIRKKLTANFSLLPQYTSIPLVHLGHARRLNDFFGYDSHLLYSDKEVLGTLGLFYMYHHFNLRLAGLLSNTGYGAELRGNFQLGLFNSSFNLQKNWQYKNRLLSDYSLSLNPFTQADLTIGYSFPYGIGFNLRGQWRENNSADMIQSSQYTLSPMLQIPLFQYDGFRADLGLSYTLSSQDQLGMATLRLQQSTPIGINLSSQTQLQYQPAQQKQFSFNTDINANWQDTQQGFTDKRVALDLRKQPDSQTMRLTGDYLTSSFGFAGFAEHSLPNQGKGITNYGGQMTTNIVGDKEGVSLGGLTIGESSIIVDLRGSPQGAGFDVLASRLAKLPGSENKIANAYVGAKNVIALEPYETYQIRLAPHKTTFAHHENKTYITTLYPATVARLVWKVEQAFTLITVVVHPDGSLVKNAKVEGGFEPAMTDEQGLLQAEVSAENTLSLKSKIDEVCHIELPKGLTPKNGIVIVDKLICQPVEAKAESK
jgi:hypothetical protein